MLQLMCQKLRWCKYLWEIFCLFCVEIKDILFIHFMFWPLVTTAYQWYLFHHSESYFTNSILGDCLRAICLGALIPLRYSSSTTWSGYTPTRQMIRKFFVFLSIKRKGQIVWQSIYIALSSGPPSDDVRNVLVWSFRHHTRGKKGSRPLREQARSLAADILGTISWARSFVTFSKATDHVTLELLGNLLEGGFGLLTVSKSSHCLALSLTLYVAVCIFAQCFFFPRVCYTFGNDGNEHFSS